MNKEEIYQKEIMPLMKKIEDICKKNSIPNFMAVAVADDGKETVYKHFFLTPAVAEEEVADDKITKMLNVMNGFNTVPAMPILDFVL